MMTDAENNSVLPKTGSQNNLLVNEQISEVSDSNYIKGSTKDSYTEIFGTNLTIPETVILTPNVSPSIIEEPIKGDSTEQSDTPRAVINKTITVEPTLFLSFFALSFQVITSSSLLIDKICHVTYNYSDEVCKNYTAYSNASDKIQSYSTDLGMYKNLIETIPPVLYSFFLGSWSDKHGRKFPIIFPISGYLCSTICNTLFAYYIDTPPEYLMISSVFIGLTGGSVSMIMGCFSYVTDITVQANRTKRIAIADLAVFIALPVGLALSSVIYNQWGYIPNYVISLVLYCACLFYSALYLTETIVSENDENNCCVIWNIFDIHNVRDNLKIFTQQRKGNERIYISLMLLSMFILLFPITGDSNIMLLFVEKMIGWDQTIFGYYTAYTIVISAIGTILVFKLFIKRYNVTDLVLSITGLIGIILKSILTAISSAGWMLYMAASVSCFQFIGMPSIRSFVSKLVAKEEVGKLYAVISSVEAMSPLFSNIIYSQTYNATRDTFAGAVFLLIAGLMIIPFSSFTWIYFNKKKLDKYKLFEDSKKICNSRDPIIA